MKFALIAHDNKKANMVAFVSKRYHSLIERMLALLQQGQQVNM